MTRRDFGWLGLLLYALGAAVLSTVLALAGAILLTLVVTSWVTDEPAGVWVGKRRRNR